MNSNIKYLPLLIIVLLSYACNPAGNKTESGAAGQVGKTGYDKQYIVDQSASSIAWQGYKPTGTHNGTVTLVNGNIEISEGKLSGGSFEIDMNSIKVLDLEDPEYNAKLTGHLKSADFFDVAAYPDGKFEITAVEPIDGSKIDKEKEKGDLVPNHAITGNLTLKGITRSISFNALVSMNEQEFNAETNQFFIDRAEWNVQYGSRKFFDDLKDKFINDEMGITIRLKASPDEKAVVSN